MTTVEVRIFNLLDNYSKARHQCSLAEMFLNGPKTEYILCFRPAGGDKESPGRYACRYVRLTTEEAAAVGQVEPLLTSVAEKLDKELAS